MAEQANNIRGMHHISMKCTKEEYKKVNDFYAGILGLKISKTFGCEEIPDGVMIDLHNSCIEIFTNRSKDFETGVICHYALNVDNVDELAGRIKEAGYEVFKGPKDITLASQPETQARIAFCYGPLGEQIELFSEK